MSPADIGPFFKSCNILRRTGSDNALKLVSKLTLVPLPFYLDKILIRCLSKQYHICIKKQ